MFADLETSILEKGRYMSFGFRIDTRKIPSAILKKHLAEMTRDELQRQGKTFISKSRKKELKDLCKSLLLSKTEPRPSMTGIAIDTSNGLVYVASTSKSTLELFENYAKTAFGGEMERMYPSTLPASDSEHPLEALMSNIYAESMTLSRTDGPSVSVTDAPDSARAGLESGLLLTSLKIRLSSMPEDELVAVFTLNADFSFSGLKTPRIRRQKGEDADPDTDFLLKMASSERL